MFIFVSLFYTGSDDPNPKYGWGGGPRMAKYLLIEEESREE